jgi:hypothetical protein
VDNIRCEVASCARDGGDEAGIRPGWDKWIGGVLEGPGNSPERESHFVDAYLLIETLLVCGCGSYDVNLGPTAGEVQG